MDKIIDGAATAANTDACAEATQSRITNTLTNPILTELVEAGARKALNVPLTALRDTAQQAKEIYAGLSIIRSENIRPDQNLQNFGKDIFESTNRYLRSAADNASHVAKLAGTLDPKAQLAHIASQCDGFMKEYGTFVTTQGAVDIVSTANKMRDAVNGFKSSYADYLKLAAKREHPRVATSDNLTAVGV